jgi:PAS domain S-box-containing protein
LGYSRYLGWEERRLGFFFRWRTSVRFRMVVVTVAAVTATVALYTVVQYFNHAQSAVHAQRERSERLITLMAESLAQPMFDFNDIAVLQAVKALGAMDGVCQVRVVDSNQHIVVETGAGVNPNEIMLNLRRAIIYRSGNRVVGVGQIEMAFSRVPLDAELLRSTLEMLLIGLMMAVSTVVAVLWAFRSVTRPLVEVAAGLGRLAAGDTGIALPAVVHDDEFGQMCAAMERFREAILARDEAEAAMCANEARFRDFSMSSADWFWEVDGKLRFTYLSENFSGIFGVDIQSLLGRRKIGIADFYLLNQASVSTVLRKCIRHRSAFRNVELCVRRAGGVVMWIAVNGRPRFSSAGQFLGYRGTGQDITIRRDAEELIRKLSLAVEQSPSNIIITDAQGDIEYVNEAFTATTGYGFDEVRGQNPRFLQSGQTPAETFASMWHALNQGLPWRGELVNRRKNGEIYIERGIIAPLRQPDGSVTHYLAIKDDITEKKKVEEELRLYRQRLEQMVEERTSQLAEAKDAAEEASRAKGTFLANMSHEIRTPLNAVLGLARIIMRESHGRRSGLTAKQILEAGEHLLGVINDILDFSRIEAGKMLIEKRPFRLLVCVEYAFKLVATRAQAKGLALNSDCHESPQQWVEGDRLRVEQILINLLANAVKFTDKGGVCLSVSRSGEKVRFSVRDTGIGMSAEQLARLFQPFEQADASTTRKYGGSGLGLIISRNLARQMGGDISVTSQVGQGSEFVVTLPLPEVAPASPDGTAAEGALRLGGLRILAVEDIELNRIVLEDILEIEGAAVVFAENGQQALGLIDNTPIPGFDLVLTDIQMPIMDGYELAQHIHTRFPTLPILGLSAHTLAEDRQRCAAVGMLGHVSKPIDPENLVANICRHVRWLVSGGEPTEILTEEAPAGADQIDWKALTERYHGRMEFTERLFGVLLRTHSETPSRLRKAVCDNDLDAVSRISHSVVGVAGNVEAFVVQALASQLVQAVREKREQVPELVERLADSMEALFKMLRSRVSTGPHAG